MITCDKKTDSSEATFLQKLIGINPNCPCNFPPGLQCTVICPADQGRMWGQDRRKVCKYGGRTSRNQRPFDVSSQVLLLFRYPSREEIALRQVLSPSPKVPTVLRAALPHPILPSSLKLHSFIVAYSISYHWDDTKN